MNADELDRADDRVDEAVDRDHEADELRPDGLRVDHGDDAAERHHEVAVADVDALLAGQHVHPVLKDIVREQNHGDHRKRDDAPGPAGVLPVGERTDGISREPLHEFDHDEKILLLIAGKDSGTVPCPFRTLSGVKTSGVGEAKSEDEKRERRTYRRPSRPGRTCWALLREGGAAGLTSFP